MEKGKSGILVGCLIAVADRPPERTGYPASKYSNRDVVNSAFAAFFFQFPRQPRYMREMEDREKRSNAQSLFDVSGIPNDNQISNRVGKIVKPRCTKVLPAATEIISNSDGTKKQDRELTAGKKKHIHYIRQYLNDIPIQHDEWEPFPVNYMSLEIQAKGAIKPSYRNSWIMNEVLPRVKGSPTEMLEAPGK